jgi:hypothetical protein
MAAAVGAGHVTDDTWGDFTQAPEKHDGVIDITGNQTLPGPGRVLVPNGAVAAAGDSNKGRRAGSSARPTRMAALVF